MTKAKKFGSVTPITTIIFVFVFLTMFLSPGSNLSGKIDTYGFEHQDKKVLNHWLAAVTRDARMHGNKKFTAILFDENFNIAWVNRSYGAVGDLIYVAVIKEKDEADQRISVTFHPCSQEPAAPELFVGQQVTLPGGQNIVPPKEDDETGEQESTEQDRTGEKGSGMVKFPPRSCFSRHVTITVKKAGGNSTGTFILEQYQRYRAALQFGVVFSDMNAGDFIVQEGKIFNEGPTNTGPHYMLYTVIYAAPRYIGSFFSSKKFYEGRDILHDLGFFDRIGAVVGVGINNKIFDTFHLGLSFEVMYGVNFIGVWEITRLNQLAEGYNPGDDFSGETIPQVKIWKTGFAMGLSLDLRYVYSFFNK